MKTIRPNQKNNNQMNIRNKTKIDLIEKQFYFRNMYYKYCIRMHFTSLDSEQKSSFSLVNNVKKKSYLYQINELG